MESLSRPFHSRKVSNATSFSTKNAYADVFSGHRHKFAGPSTIDVSDYREIFGSSQANFSIPVLDVSTLTASSDASNLNLRHSKPDYSNIFGGFRDEQVGFYYDELFTRDKREPSLKTPTSQDLDNSANQSPDALKTFNMSYSKIRPKSKDGFDGTKHDTQLPAIPGFTRFIEEPVPVSTPKMEAKKNNSSCVHVSVDFSKENASVPKVRKFNIFDIDFGIHSSTVSSPSASPINRRSDPKRSAAINSESYKTDTSESGPGGFSCTYFDEEIDVNSDASASAAALKKAIDKAQESIRIAKESVGRKKKGLKSFSKKGSTEDVTAATSSQIFPDVRTNCKYGGTLNYKGFMNGEKLFVAKKVIDEMNGKISESTKECYNRFEDNNTTVSKPTQVTGETESRPVNSAGKDEYTTSSSEAVDTEKSRTVSSDCIHAYPTNNMFVDDYEDKIKVTKTNTSILEHPSAVKEQELVERAYELDETVDVENNDEVRLSNGHELADELNKLSVSQNLEDEMEDSQGSTRNDSEKRSNEKQENVENAKERSHRIETDDEASEGIESESKDDDHKEAESGEILYDVCKREMNKDAQTYDYSIEDSEVNLRDDCEIRQENNHTGEIKEESVDDTLDQEFDEASSLDDEIHVETDSIDEIHVASNIVDMSDNVETTQDIDDIAGVFRESQVEETELMKQADASEEEAFSDDHVEDYEVKCEENDAQSESFSGTTHDVKLEVEECSEEKNLPEQTNIQVPENEIPDIKTTNEIKASQKPPVLNETDKNTVNEIGETVPSKVSGKENSRRIDEMTAKHNRLAVDRAIREARERAFAEARERAERERAAVEKATEEVRQRMMADAREKVVGNKLSSSDRTSAQSKLRAERAAVERATAEARQRALEKAISQKNVSDLNISESALRNKAKLEKHNRIMERAAKALAEKEKRDLLAQKEQAERNRLAENLDADIRRWSNGKEKNLRALLSTLQYILGPESGWKPVTMTEIISSSAVKKAYRKATLCVHPDKLQQRGASIQHKYICEKVFDLLKAAWNRFNSEEK